MLPVATNNLLKLLIPFSVATISLWVCTSKTLDFYPHVLLLFHCSDSIYQHICQTCPLQKQMTWYHLHHSSSIPTTAIFFLHDGHLVSQLLSLLPAADHQHNRQGDPLKTKSDSVLPLFKAPKASLTLSERALRYTPLWTPIWPISPLPPWPSEAELGNYSNHISSLLLQGRSHSPLWWGCLSLEIHMAQAYISLGLCTKRLAGPFCWMVQQATPILWFWYYSYSLILIYCYQSFFSREFPLWLSGNEPN